MKGLSLSHYWTDSKVVLGYLSNVARRFHVFVPIRNQQIRDRTKQSQWKHPNSKQNHPADIASRVATAKEIHRRSKGPEFLWERELPERDEPSEVDPDDPEVKRSHCFTSKFEHIQFGSLLDRLQYFSD